MNDFQKIKFDIENSKNITIDFFESDKNASVLLIKICGKIPNGSAGFDDCKIINQKIGLSLISSTFIGILLDIRELEYNYGNSIVDAFSSLDRITIGNENYPFAFIISDKNKYGLSSLWNFEIDNPKEFMFYEFAKAFEYINQCRFLNYFHKGL